MTRPPQGGNAPPLTLRQVADLVGGRVVGDGDAPVGGIAPVDEALPSHMAFLGVKRYTKYVGVSRASAFLVAADLEEHLPPDVPRVVVDEPHPALRLLLAHFFPPDDAGPASVHPTAVLGRGVRLGSEVGIGPYAVLGDDVSVGDGTRIGAHCVIGRRSSVGRQCTLHPHVVMYHDSIVGDRVIVHSGARIGSDGFGYAFVDGAHRKMPQVGRAVIEDDVEVGANTTIDRGSLGDTRVGPGTKLDNLVQVAHNVRIGAASLLAALVGIAGSTRIGNGVWLGGQSGAINHLEIGDGARAAVASKILRDVPAGETVSGHPARSHREDLRRQAHLSRLPDLVDRVKRLEAEIERLAGAADRPSSDASAG